MTENTFQTQNVERLDEVTVPETPNKQAPTARTPRNVGLVTALVCLAIAVGATATATFLATRPAMNSLKDDLNAATNELKASQADVQAQTADKATCFEANLLASDSFDHWHAYMDDVQSLYLANSAAEVNKVTDRLRASYRAVVEDKVPVASAAKKCQAVGTET